MDTNPVFQCLGGELGDFRSELEDITKMFLVSLADFGHQGFTLSFPSHHGRPHIKIIISWSFNSENKVQSCMIFQYKWHTLVTYSPWDCDEICVEFGTKHQICIEKWYVC